MYVVKQHEKNQILESSTFDLSQTKYSFRNIAYYYLSAYTRNIDRVFLHLLNLRGISETWH